VEVATVRCSTTGMATSDIDTFRRRLGESVQTRRKSKRMTQEQLAEATESSTEWISQVERGIGMPSVELLLRLADALDADAVDLVSAATNARAGRPLQQRLDLLTRELDDRDLAILLAAATAMARP